MNLVGMAPIAKSVFKYINITSIAYLHCLLRFFVGSGFVCSRTRGLHGMDWGLFDLEFEIFMGTAFPCKNIYGNGVPMRSRSTTPL